MRAHLARLVPELGARRDALLDGLAAHLPRGARIRRPEHGAHLWLPLPPWLAPERVEAQARRCGVLVTPSTAFAVGGHERPGLRLTFAAEPKERLAEGARRLGKAMSALAGSTAQLPAAAEPRLAPLAETVRETA
jgi:DNA-binding transcriptional MocR family regulator